MCYLFQKTSGWKPKIYHVSENVFSTLDALKLEAETANEKLVLVFNRPSFKNPEGMIRKLLKKAGTTNYRCVIPELNLYISYYGGGGIYLCKQTFKFVSRAVIYLIIKLPGSFCNLSHCGQVCLTIFKSAKMFSLYIFIIFYRDKSL